MYIAIAGLVEGRKKGKGKRRLDGGGGGRDLCRKGDDEGRKRALCYATALGIPATTCVAKYVCTYICMYICRVVGHPTSSSHRDRAILRRCFALGGVVRRRIGFGGCSLRSFRSSAGEK